MPRAITTNPVWNVYSVMLIVALISMLMACLFLTLEINQYGFGSHKGALTSVAPGTMQAVSIYYV